MRSSLSTLAAASLVLLLSACSGGPPPTECVTGATQECYSGPEGTAGRGVCKKGTQTCRDGAWSVCEGEVLPTPETCGDGIDNDCNGLDDGTRNACGGCAELAGAPGTPCAGCGTWKCDGKDAVVCGEPTPKAGTNCAGPDGCVGTYTCDETEGQMVCNAPRKNECGKCGGPELTDKGADCTTPSGCSGKLACSLDGGSLFCEGPAKNICGVCGGPTVAGVGGTCASASGCNGILICNQAGTGTECQVTTTKNECGKCGGPPINGLGDSCSSNDGCSGTMVCSANGEQAVCNAPAKNNCGACGGPTIGGIGNNCTLNGCSGTLQCNAQGNGTTCNAPTKNQCGVCGGPDLPLQGTSCSNADGCSGTWVCDAGGTALSCNAVAKNACGACAPPVSGVGSSCTAANGCQGTRVCNANGTGTDCVTQLVKNECGVCGGPDLPTKGQACTNSDGCNGTLVCNAAGDALTCNAPVKNACDTCAPPITGLGDACTAANGCQGNRVCNASGTGTDCTTQLAKNECGVCGGPAVSGVGDACSNADLCTGQLVCNAAGNATECNAPVKNACNTCGPPVIGLGEDCTSSQGCEGTVMCRADGMAPECVSMLTPNECGLCGGVPVTGIGDACTDTTTGCSGTLACNASKDGTVCNAVCGANHVVISEFATEHTNSNNEFVELYNPTNSPVDISGWKLQYKSATGGSYTGSFTIPGGSVVAPKGYFLLGSGSYSGSPTRDVSWGTTFNLSADSGHIRIGPSSMGNGKNDANAVDTVGYGSNADSPEGTRISANHPTTGSYERKARETSTAATMGSGGADELKGNGWDTNVNSADFVIRTTRQPQNKTSPTETP